MFAQIITENGVKKIQPLTADVGAGAPVGSLAMMYKKSAPSGYLYCDGSTFNAATYPALYAYLGSNVLPDYDTSRQSGEPYSYIKATSGLAENQQENVLATINENNSYSTTEQPTGAKWIDGKPIYRKVVTGLNYGGTMNDWIDTGATLTNGETLIKAEGIRYSNNVYYVLNIISFRLSGNSIQYLTPIVHGNTNILIVEYTKTTD